MSLPTSSLEAFVKEHGWDRKIVTWMREHNDVAMGGYTTHIPRFTLGRDLAGHPDFVKFREPGYTVASSDRAFFHVQGGAYCIRREALRTYGFFNKRVPQNNMDVEFSYFLESRGAKIERIPGVLSITTKTRPELYSVITESTLVAHPLTAATVKHTLDSAKMRTIWRCNLCNHDHAVSATTGYQPKCEDCGSTAFDRAAYVQISHDFRLHRGLSAAFLCEGSALRHVCQKALRVTHDESSRALRAKLENVPTIGLAIVDWDIVPIQDRAEFANILGQKLTKNSALIGANSDDWRAAPLLPPAREKFADLASSFLKSDWRQFTIYDIGWN